MYVCVWWRKQHNILKIVPLWLNISQARCCLRLLLQPLHIQYMFKRLVVQLFDRCCCMSWHSITSLLSSKFLSKSWSFNNILMRYLPDHRCAASLWSDWDRPSLHTWQCSLRRVWGIDSPEHLSMLWRLKVEEDRKNMKSDAMRKFRKFQNLERRCSSS